MRAEKTKPEESGNAAIVFVDIPLSLKENIRERLHIISHRKDPEDTKDQEDDDASREEEGFFIDENIPLPVEIEAGKDPHKDGGLSWEMIVAAMIKIAAAPYEYGVDAERVDYYRRFVLALKPDIFSELSGAAVIKARNGDFDMALEIIALLDGLAPGSPELLLSRALILEDRAEAERGGGDEEEKGGKNIYGEVYEAYEKLLSIEPVLPEALFNAAYFYLKRGDYSRARDCFSGYITVGENDEKLETSLSMVKDIESRGLDDGDFLDALALIRSGNDEDGLLKIKSFLERRPTVWNGWFVLGWALRRLGRWEDSLESFRKAVELGGGNSDTRNEMAICLMETGDLAAARRELLAALRDDPENTKIISNLGVLALKDGDDDLAAGFFRTVLELDPEDQIALNYFGTSVS